MEKLLAQATTGFAVGSDTCIIRRLGSTPISFDPALTLKLTNLPRGFTPYELNRILENQGTYFGIHIPFIQRPECHDPKRSFISEFLHSNSSFAQKYSTLTIK